MRRIGRIPLAEAAQAAYLRSTHHAIRGARELIMGTTIDRRTTLLALAGTALAGCGGGDGGEAIASAPPPPPTQSTPEDGALYFAPGDLVPGSVAVAWSERATSVLHEESLTRPKGLWPVEQARILETAFYAAFAVHADIVSELRPSGPYSTWATNPEVAVGAAIHSVLYELVPAQRARIDRALDAALTSVPEGNAKARGLQAGQSRARLQLDSSSSDGMSLADVAYTPREGVGEYQPMSADEIARFADVSLVRLRSSKIASADQFRPPPPDDPWGERFAADLAEVRALGGRTDSARTAEQNEIAQFWAEPVPLAWQRLAADFWAGARRAAGRDDVQTLFQQFAGLQSLIFDGYVAALDAAYFYRFWRPATAIRSGFRSLDATADSTWQPLLRGGPPWPEYVSGDAAASALAAWLIPGFAFDSPLRDFSCTSASLPGVRRSFHTLNDVVAEISDSRVYAGHQFRNGVAKGLELGLRIASNPVPP
jgi:hypothetical protein